MPRLEGLLVVTEPTHQTPSSLQPLVNTPRDSELLSLAHGSPALEGQTILTARMCSLL